jgi:hypothetical protein
MSDLVIAMRLRLALMLSVCVAAALLTHWVIDLLGDFVLAHDPYDDLAHYSRDTGALTLGLFLLAAIGFTLRAALLEARGDGGALLELLRQVRPRNPWGYFAIVAGASLVLVAAMEWCDAAAAGRPCDDIIDLFGGSLLLASTCATAIAGLLTLAVTAGLRRLTKLHRAIVAIVVAFIRIAYTLGSLEFLCRDGRRIPGAARLTVTSTGGRAPPAFPSRVSF